MIYLNAAPLAATLDALQAGQHSFSLYLEEMHRRIELVNPHIEAFLPEPGRLDRWRAEAAVLRERSLDANMRPPLLGALVGVKDVFHVDGFVTRAGTQVPPELFAGREAVCVQRLRAAGALVAGKTVTTEFAYFEPGPTHNPHNLEHTPGGSSSGSAAAVAAGLCSLALGTQTIGSVIRPAAFCGIVGFKPTLGRIPPEGLVFFSRTIDHVGLFTQDVAGMRVAAAELCDGWRPEGSSEMLSALFGASSSTSSGTSWPVLGVPDEPYLAQAEKEALDAFEAHLLMLQVAGCEVRRIEAFHDIGEWNAEHRRLVFGEFAREHAPFFEENQQHYRPKTVEAIRAGQGVRDDELQALRGRVTRSRDEIEKLMDEQGIDLWVTPSATGPAPRGIEATGDPAMSLPWTHMGMPAISLPMGKARNGLPLGLQLVARFGADEVLLDWARRLEPLATEPRDA
jgi:Asp-tRNA(Asn)/Glu-tRNA(Gln) amidotransferase A subunit family amidase